VVRASFKPEFLNRLDDLVVFSALDGRSWADRRAPDRRLAKRLAERRLTLESATRPCLARGQRQRPGVRGAAAAAARPDGDRDRLAKEILAGEVKDGDTVRVDAFGDGLIVGPGPGSQSSTRLATPSGNGVLLPGMQATVSEQMPRFSSSSTWWDAPRSLN
jgi:ATP-dependent Clp protease ATP-binding subunit ClpB